MLTVSVTIESTLKAKLDETGMYLDEKTQKKLDNLMERLDKECNASGLENVEINYDFYDDDDEEEDILSEGITVMEVKRDSSPWSTGDNVDEVEEEGKKYKKT